MVGRYVIIFQLATVTPKKALIADCLCVWMHDRHHWFIFLTRLVLMFVWYFSNLSVSLSCRRGATSSTFVTFVPLNKRWTEDLHASTSHTSAAATLHSRCPVKESTALPHHTWPEKCVCACILGCMTVSECFWAEVSCTPSLTLWEALLHLTDYDICLHNCKASWEGKRFRSNGSQMKGTSRWVLTYFFICFSFLWLVIMDKGCNQQVFR